VTGEAHAGDLAYKEERSRLLKRFGANVQRVRRSHERGVSQEELAMLTRLHRTEIGKIEQGIVEPRLSTLLILAEGLEVSIAELVEGLSAPSERKPAPGGRRGRRVGGA
jgi:transcriptional regulator with XRE-family HTH domain